MTIPFDKLFDLDISYPGLSFGLESWAFMAYVDTLPEQIVQAQERYVTAGRARLGIEKDHLPSEEIAEEFADILEAADEHIPRFVRGGAVVAAWGLFESFTKKCMQYVEHREMAVVPLARARGKNLCACVENFLASVRLPQVVNWTHEQRKALTDLQELRNVLAHCNGYLMDLPSERLIKIEALVKRLSGVQIEGSAIRLSQEFVNDAAALAIEMGGLIVNGVASHYDGPTFPKRARPTGS